MNKTNQYPTQIHTRNPALEHPSATNLYLSHGLLLYYHANENQMRSAMIWGAAGHPAPGVAHTAPGVAHNTPGAAHIVEAIARAGAAAALFEE